MQEKDSGNIDFNKVLHLVSNGKLEQALDALIHSSYVKQAMKMKSDLQRNKNLFTQGFITREELNIKENLIAQEIILLGETTSSGTSGFLSNNKSKLYIAFPVLTLIILLLFYIGKENELITAQNEPVNTITHEEADAIRAMTSKVSTINYSLNNKDSVDLIRLHSEFDSIYMLKIASVNNKALVKEIRTFKHCIDYSADGKLSQQKLLTLGMKLLKRCNDYLKAGELQPTRR